ncbi:MAG: hypothetical protein CVU00_12380 [Bacteroidetes bacterium HGW-Bacteroidetes-17]|jgi:hypothetical protein|nr:MAG: hypothetical protein CVU00_12380 [Bacteroidetes bacterium HGW-Bacteroidetes-17]
MDEEQKNSLKKNMDELIRLFKKIKDKSVIDDLPGINKMFIQNFDLLVQNYDEIKDDLSEQLLSQFGTPIHKMIADIVVKLKKELGEDLTDEIELPEKKPQEIKKILITPEPLNIEVEIKSIDSQLNKGGLTPEQIDRLLDRRSDLAKKKSSKS